MSERKVLNKYYPPDFDPSKIPRGKRNKNATFNIRIMAPFNMRCNMCKEYIYKGKKFNSRKEDVTDEDFLGLRIFRFYIKCPRCVSEIAFKTDLQNTDYTLEAGATRLFEAEKIAQQMAEQERKEREEDELNPMKVLENRTKASQLEMEQIDTLEELREINSRKNTVNTDEMIEKYRKYEEMLQKLQMEQEEQEIRDIFGSAGTKVVKRLDDSDSDNDEPEKKKAKPVATEIVKPTDILASDGSVSITSATISKPPAVWERSVGGLSSQSKLKGLVVKKKPSSTVLSAYVSMKENKELESSDKDLGAGKGVMDTKNIEITADSNESGSDEKSVKGEIVDGIDVDGRSCSVNTKLTTAKETSSKQKEGEQVKLMSKKTETEEANNDRGQSMIAEGGGDKRLPTGQSKQENGGPPPPVMLQKVGTLGGLSMLGAYSDSDSDSSG